MKSQLLPCFSQEGAVLPDLFLILPRPSFLLGAPSRVPSGCIWGLWEFRSPFIPFKSCWGPLTVHVTKSRSFQGRAAHSRLHLRSPRHRLPLPRSLRPSSVPWPHPWPATLLFFGGLAPHSG